jgi:enterochelin esterase-like enzyme
MQIKEIKFKSNYLGKKMAMLVYLPENYDHIDYLPVLYFLHGRSGDENILYDADINKVADSLIGNKKIKPMIIVCPRIENSRGINSSLKCEEVADPFGRIINRGMYEDYFIKEVIPIVDKSFHTISDRNGRYIGGASAGGYAALHYALRYQNLFSKVGGHMPAIELQLENEDLAYFTENSSWEKYDPISIVKRCRISPNINIYLDAGDNDEGEFYNGCSILYDLLQKNGIHSQNHIFKGHHNVEYIKSNMEKYLMFYGGTID